MTKYFCDKCQKEIGVEQNRIVFEFTKRGTQNPSPFIYKILCHVCFEAFDELYNKFFKKS